jgi:hypothetical protein
MLKKENSVKVAHETVSRRGDYRKDLAGQSLGQ